MASTCEPIDTRRMQRTAALLRAGANNGLTAADELDAAADVLERARELVQECRAALAEELAGWDIDPPLAHVKQAHDRCIAWQVRFNAELCGGTSATNAVLNG